MISLLNSLNNYRNESIGGVVLNLRISLLLDLEWLLLPRNLHHLQIEKVTSLLNSQRLWAFNRLQHYFLLRVYILLLLQLSGCRWPYHRYWQRKYLFIQIQVQDLLFTWTALFSNGIMVAQTLIYPLGGQKISRWVIALSSLMFGIFIILFIL